MGFGALAHPENRRGLIGDVLSGMVLHASGNGALAMFCVRVFGWLVRLRSLGFRGLGFIEIVKGLGAESFERNVLSRFSD